MIQSPIGFIGAGHMAEALIRGLLDAGICMPEKILAADINEIRLAHVAKTFGISTCPHNPTLLQQASLIILAVKPQQVAEVLHELSSSWDEDRHVLFSIAAGISTEYLEKMSGCELKVVRVMPNTPAYLQVGATAFCLGQFAGEAETLLAHLIFEAVGIVVRVEERFMNAVTALSGSGPAYVFKLCEIMISAGLEMGLPAAETESLVKQTVLGAARMWQESGKDVASLRQAVTSPGGTTEAALRVLASSDFESVFIQAIKAARDRGQALMPNLLKG